MITIELAVRLAAAGLAWTPASGDRFVIANRDMDADVFVVSELTIRCTGPDRAADRFTATRNCALDASSRMPGLAAPETICARAGPRFRRLGPVVALRRVSSWTVPARHVDVDAERATPGALAVPRA